ncbi:DUF4393 domain-containing protein [Steroidobacter sp. S1-65]|uniref:DUF4393 domain-containing protein n=2 Tax=Steroidobacter gossypii TaxID=2805490 RepID=A0ABS1WWE5_9GAMM|nr:DUF4393 domain-containing protein [Steroidobacter gossypii]
MTDGIGKIVDSKLIHRSYQDLASPAAKQLGELAGDTIKAFRLFTAPIQLLAAGQERFGRWLDAVRDSVPRERQREAPPEIAGPVLMNLRFMDESSKLHHLYLNLLRAAIDQENVANAHPGFIKAIEQMAPSDALLLNILFETVPFQWVVSRDDVRPRALSWMLHKEVSKLMHWQEEDIQTGLEVFVGAAADRLRGVRCSRNARESHQLSVSYVLADRVWSAIHPGLHARRDSQLNTAIR